MTQKEDPKYVSDEAKNGLVTANGVILAFVLGFFINYASVSQEWRLIELLPMGMLCLSMALLSLSLYRTFIPYTQIISYFEKTVRIMMWGIFTSIIGALLGVFI